MVLDCSIRRRLKVLPVMCILPCPSVVFRLAKGLDASIHEERTFAQSNSRMGLLLGLPPAEHEHWYTTVWSPMQSRLGERFDDYMRDFLLKDGQPIRPDEVYQEWRKRLGPLDEEGIRSVLRELAEWSLEYDQILNPRRETDAEVRAQLQRRCVRAIRR